MSDGTNVAKVSKEILNYMRRYPDAADTEEHIIHWWLNTGDDQEAGGVSRALKILELNGYIERIELPDSRVVYRLRVAQ